MSRGTKRGVGITSVEPSSTSWDLGFRQGSRILSINAEEVTDALDVKYVLSMNDQAELSVLDREGSMSSVTLDDPDLLMADVELEPLEVKRCTSDCIYCFCKQNPPGARESLFFRDEDFRMSFLAGSYTTMAAISDVELDRIKRQRLSPQFVTVPSTDESIRRFVLGVKRARPILEVFRDLGTANIELHVQVVVVPEVNDGNRLHCTVRDLADLDGIITSVAIIPVGTTRYTRDSTVRRPTRRELRELLKTVRLWQRRCGDGDGSSWIEAADEIYLDLGLRVPAAVRYGVFPQLTTGVGMVRRFLDDVSRLRRRRPPIWRKRRIVAVTGSLFAPTLRQATASLNRRWRMAIEVLEVVNRFFGESVTVSGLLGGTEVEAAIRAAQPDVVLLPDDILDESKERFVDDTLYDELVERVAPTRLVVGDRLSCCLAQLTEFLR